MHPAFIGAAFIFGLMTGSFLNVCIYRLPHALSIVYPGSQCPQCGHRIRWYDNIPVISYLVLGGKCRHCGNSIAVRYPMVELMSGLFATAVFLNYGPSPAGLVYYVFVAVLLVVTFIDIDHQIIPDVITLPGIAFFFAASFLPNTVDWKDAALGILGGGLSLYVVAWSYERLMKKEGMGGGDIKLLAMIGAVIGWKGVFFTLFVSSLVGSVLGLVIMVFSKKDLKLAIPFGPFLAIGAMVFIFFGKPVIAWYFGLM